MGKIKLLEDNIINLIAAGEVVERPASIVKELMENSVDAGSSTVIVRVSQGGVGGIAIQDDGSGMDEEDARLAFKQHATSKITSINDLENISTLGFRGEALASISSVAEITIETKTEVGDPVKLLVHKDVTALQPSAAGSKGTTITVAKLFDEIPARKKFLKTDATEFGYIQTTFLSIALVNLGVHFELYHNDKLVYRLPATTKLTERVFNIWDANVAENLYELETAQGNIKLDVFAGSPDIARGDRKLQYLFVNGRHVSDRLLQKAITEAYQGFIHRDLQPVYFVMLNLPGELVDVNVHPRKQEVRFRDTGTMFNLMRSTIRQHLERATKESLLERVHEPSAEFAEAPSRPPMSFSDSRGASSRSIPSYRGPSHYTPQQSLAFTAQLLEPSYSQPETSASEFTLAQPQFNGTSGRYLQVFATYIVYQLEDTVVFVDQHAAAEKILYEKLTKQLDLNRSKPLLVPDIVELDSDAKAKVLSLADQLKLVGFEVADFGGNSVQVTAIPEIIPNIDATNFLRELTQAHDDTENIPMRDDIKHYIVATMACHGAIRAGQPLSQPEMTQLINDLSRCDTPYNCPHGRPVSWVLSRYDLEKGFKRVI